MNNEKTKRMLENIIPTEETISLVHDMFPDLLCDNNLAIIAKMHGIELTQNMFGSDHDEPDYYIFEMKANELNERRAKISFKHMIILIKIILYTHNNVFIECVETNHEDAIEYVRVKVIADYSS